LIIFPKAPGKDTGHGYIFCFQSVEKFFRKGGFATLNRSCEDDAAAGRVCGNALGFWGRPGFSGKIKIRDDMVVFHGPLGHAGYRGWRFSH
jgi:hypothetical protein